jgi:hypothetical protein
MSPEISSVQPCPAQTRHALLDLLAIDMGFLCPQISTEKPGSSLKSFPWQLISLYVEPLVIF